MPYVLCLSHSGWAVREKGSWKVPPSASITAPSAPEEALSRRRHSQTQTPNGAYRLNPCRAPQHLPGPGYCCIAVVLQVRICVRKFPLMEKDQAQDSKEGGKGRRRKTRHTQQDNNNLFLITILPPDQAILNTSRIHSFMVPMTLKK